MRSSSEVTTVSREAKPSNEPTEDVAAGDQEALASSDLEQLLENLKLTRMAEVLDRELARMRSEGHGPRVLLARMLREQWQARQETSKKYRITAAKIPELLSLETFPYDRQTSVRRALIEELATLEFVAQGQNLVFIGGPGRGKTGLATGLLLRALRAGHRGRFVKAQDLFDELYSSLADRSSRTLLNQLVRLPLMVVDEMGYLNLRPEQSNLFFRLMEERYTKRVATIITTNLDFPQWYEFLGNKPMVQALLDRLRHRCIEIRLEGPSLRDPENLG